MKNTVLLLVLFCLGYAVLSLALPHQEKIAFSGPPSPALLDAMSSHGIEVNSAPVAALDSPATADADSAADAPRLQPAEAFAEQMPVLQPAVYHRNGR